MGCSRNVKGIVSEEGLEYNRDQGMVFFDIGFLHFSAILTTPEAISILGRRANDVLSRIPHIRSMTPLSLDRSPQHIS